MKALVLSVLFGLVLTISVANPINQQDAAPDSLRDAADDLESYNPERQVCLLNHVIKVEFVAQKRHETFFFFTVRTTTFKFRPAFLPYLMLEVGACYYG